MEFVFQFWLVPYSKNSIFISTSFPQDFEPPHYNEIVGEIEEDEEAVDKQEEFEAKYNFRFEEGVSSQVEGHGRLVFPSRVQELGVLRVLIKKIPVYHTGKWKGL